jgi:hypothetical protein
MDEYFIANFGREAAGTDSEQRNSQPGER